MLFSASYPLSCLTHNRLSTNMNQWRNEPASREQTHFNQVLTSPACPFLAYMLATSPSEKWKKLELRPGVATCASCSRRKLGFWEPRLLIIHGSLAWPSVLHIPSQVTNQPNGNTLPSLKYSPCEAHIIWYRTVYPAWEMDQWTRTLSYAHKTCCFKVHSTF